MSGVRSTVLHGDEQLVVACRAMRPGQVGRDVAGTAIATTGGLAGSEIGRRIAGRANTAENPLGYQGMVLVLTDRRLVALGRTWLRGRAKPSVLAEIDPSSIVRVDTEGGKGTKLLRLIMTLDDGTTATVQIPRVDLKAGIALAEALRTQASE